jgi:Protein of unknown function (DUF433)
MNTPRGHFRPDNVGRERPPSERSGTAFGGVAAGGGCPPYCPPSFLRGRDKLNLSARRDEEACGMKQTEPVIHSDPEIMGGTPVFVGTRVPLATLLDYLEAGQPPV